MCNRLGGPGPKSSSSLSGSHNKTLDAAIADAILGREDLLRSLVCVGFDDSLTLFGGEPPR
jgi:hypothetical protein